MGLFWRAPHFFAVEMLWRLFVRCWGILDIYYCFFGAVFFSSLSLFRTFRLFFSFARMSVAGAESGIRTAEAELDSRYGLLKGKCIGIYNRYRAVVCFPSLG